MTQTVSSQSTKALRLLVSQQALILFHLSFSGRVWRRWKKGKFTYLNTTHCNSSVCLVKAVFDVLALLFQGSAGLAGRNGTHGQKVHFLNKICIMLIFKGYLFKRGNKTLRVSFQYHSKREDATDNS